MDCFLKADESSGFHDARRVRLEIRSSFNKIHTIRRESESELHAQVALKIYLEQQFCSFL
jgi:hypothetical protein